MDEPVLARLQRTLEAAFERHPEYLRPLLDPRAVPHVPWAGDVARTKRFLEHFTADREFRKALARDPLGAVAGRSLAVDPEELRFLWDDAFYRAMLGRRDWTAPHAVQQYRAWIGEKILYRTRLRDEVCVPQDLRQRLWRERQMKRGWGQLGPSTYEQLIHAPFAIELSEGCSVGCWFCGVSAERKKRDFLYTEANARRWGGVLAGLRAAVGPAASGGFLYWATDPLDNPDYERFALDFARICGKFPQTTTAQAHKHVERVRRLLPLSAAHGCEINRFSVLTLPIFREILAAFTAEELLHTELVVQNREASLIQSNSGRARGAPQLEKKAAADGITDPRWREVPGTIACVSGFLLNMVRGTVRLVSPCPSSDRWPDGYWTFEEARFETGEELAERIEGMIRRHMRTALRAGDVARFRPDLAFGALDDGFTLTGYGGTITYRGSEIMRAVGAAVAPGDRACGDIVVDLEDRHGWPAAETMDVLNELFADGLLDEEPFGPSRATGAGGHSHDGRVPSPAVEVPA
jgi:radical SAM family RiPP maturation amino acid epimerase